MAALCLPESKRRSNLGITYDARRRQVKRFRCVSPLRCHGLPVPCRSTNPVYAHVHARQETLRCQLWLPSLAALSGCPLWLPSLATRCGCMLWLGSFRRYQNLRGVEQLCTGPEISDGRRPHRPETWAASDPRRFAAARPRPARRDPTERSLPAVQRRPPRAQRPARGDERRVGMCSRLCADRVQPVRAAPPRYTHLQSAGLAPMRLHSVFLDAMRQ